MFTCNFSFDESSACRTTMQLLLSSNPLTENKTFVGLQSFKLLHGMALFSEILSGGSPSQEEVSTEQDSSSSFFLEISLLLFFLP